MVSLLRTASPILTGFGGVINAAGRLAFHQFQTMITVALEGVSMYIMRSVIGVLAVGVLGFTRRVSELSP